MSIIMTALALAAGAQASPATTAAPTPADHARHHQQMAKKHSTECCCCKETADGKKMACCEKHDKAGTDDHAGHSSH